MPGSKHREQRQCPDSEPERRVQNIEHRAESQSTEHSAECREQNTELTAKSTEHIAQTQSPELRARARVPRQWREHRAQ